MKRKPKKDDEVLIHLTVLNDDISHSKPVEEVVEKERENKRLVFSESGELIVATQPKENEVVVDQIYKDGFF